MKRFLLIRDEHTKILGHRILNSQLSFYLGMLQLVICLWSLAQHVFSLMALQKILYCDFSGNSTLPSLLTAVDAIIFDVGLFHALWGIDGCVAQHLDGGYGRFTWCITHTVSLLFCLPFAFVSRPKPSHLWPLLIQQSAYGVGLLILSLAALPRVLPTFMGDLSNAPLHAIMFYLLGTLLNFFLLYIYWHWYWHVEETWNSARKVKNERQLLSHNRRTGHPTPTADLLVAYEHHKPLITSLLHDAAMFDSSLTQQLIAPPLNNSPDEATTLQRIFTGPTAAEQLPAQRAPPSSQLANHDNENTGNHSRLRCSRTDGLSRQSSLLNHQRGTGIINLNSFQRIDPKRHYEQQYVIALPPYQSIYKTGSESSTSSETHRNIQFGTPDKKVDYVRLQMSKPIDAEIIRIKPTNVVKQNFIPSSRVIPTSIGAQRVHSNSTAPDVLLANIAFHLLSRAIQ